MINRISDISNACTKFLLTPNYVTIIRIMLTPVFAYLLYNGFAIIAFVVFVFACITDWIDGYIARKTKAITTTGKYLDPLADKFLMSTAFGVFTVLGLVAFWMFLLIVLRDILITALRTHMQSKNRTLVPTRSAKWKTFFQMTSVYFMLTYVMFEQVASSSFSESSFVAFVQKHNLIYYLMLVVTVVTVATGVSYLRDHRRYLKSLAIAFYRVFVPTNVR